MYRYEQRRAAALRNPQIAAGYREMDAEIACLRVKAVLWNLPWNGAAPRQGRYRDDPKDKGYSP